MTSVNNNGGIIRRMRYMYRTYRAVEFINKEEKRLKKEFNKRVDEFNKLPQEKQRLTIYPRQKYPSTDNCIDYFLTKPLPKWKQKIGLKRLSEDDVEDILESADAEGYIVKTNTWGLGDHEYRIKPPKGRRMLVDRIWIFPYALWNEIVHTYSPLEKLALSSTVIAVLLFFFHAGAYIIRWI